MDKWFKDILPDKELYHNTINPVIHSKSGNFFPQTFHCSQVWARVIPLLIWRVLRNPNNPVVILPHPTTGYLDHRHSKSGPPFSSFGPSRDYGMGKHLWDEDKRRSFLKLARYCKISSRSEDSLFVFWRLFLTFMEHILLRAISLVGKIFGTFF
jgi:hypothetical protein